DEKREDKDRACYGCRPARQTHHHAQRGRHSLPPPEAQPAGEHVADDCRHAGSHLPVTALQVVSHEHNWQSSDRQGPFQKIEGQNEKAPFLSQDAPHIGGADIAAAVLAYVDLADKTPGQIAERRRSHEIRCGDKQYSSTDRVHTEFVTGRKDAGQPSVEKYWSVHRKMSARYRSRHAPCAVACKWSTETLDGTRSVPATLRAALPDIQR